MSLRATYSEPFFPVVIINQALDNVFVVVVDEDVLSLMMKKSVISLKFSTSAAVVMNGCEAMT